MTDCAFQHVQWELQCGPTILRFSEVPRGHRPRPQSFLTRWPASSTDTFQQHVSLQGGAHAGHLAAALACALSGHGIPRIEIQAVIKDRHRMGECPIWEEETRQLVYVDITAQTVCRWNPLSQQLQALSLGQRVGCVALRGKGSYVVAAGTCLGFLDWDLQRVQWVAQLDTDKPHNRFNDGKVDPVGRFVAGTMPEPSSPGMWEQGQGSLYALHDSHCVTRLLSGLGIPNGLDWSSDQRTLYHVDSLDYAVHAYDYDVQTGSVANQRLLYELPPDEGMPDGLCVDSSGTLWVACIDGGKVIRLDPQTGTRLCSVQLPASRVTSCCFGGPDYSDLYVTSAADGLSPEQLSWEPQAGHVFKVGQLCQCQSLCGWGHRDLGGRWGRGGWDVCPVGHCTPSLLNLAVNSWLGLRWRWGPPVQSGPWY